jgi:hypothetical protein
MQQAYSEIVSAVDAVRSQWRARRALTALLRAAAVAALAFTLAALFDHAIAGGVATRLLLAVAAWSAILGTAALALRPVLVRHSDDYFAALIEQRCPTLRTRLINGLQLGRESGPWPVRLVDAVVHDAARALDDVDLSAAGRDEAWRRAAALLAGALAIAACYFGASGPAGRTALARVINPFAAIAPFTWTSVTLAAPATPRVLEGSDVELDAAVTGRRAAGVILHWSDAGGKTGKAAMQPRGTDGYRYRLAAVQSTLQLHATAGDGVSDTVTLTVDPRPRVEAIDAVLHAPAYALQPPQTLSAPAFEGHLRALPGSRALLTVHASKELESLRLHVEGQPPRPATRRDDRTWQVELAIADAMVYHFSMRDRQGYEVDDPVRYTVTLQRDGAPMVALPTPGRDLQLRPDATLTLNAVAQDDLGLARVQVLAVVNPPQGKAEPAPVVWASWEHPSSAGEATPRIELPMAKLVTALNLRGGDRVQFWASAQDRNDVSPQGPGQAASRRYHLLVLTDEQAASLLDAQLQQYQDIVREMLRLQQLNRATTASLGAALELIDRQVTIRRQAGQLAEVMQRNAFPAQTIIDELRSLAAGPMAQAVSALEGYRDAAGLDAAKLRANAALPPQDQCIEALESILRRLSRDQQVRQTLQRMEKQDPEAQKQIVGSLDKLAAELDKFLTEQRRADDYAKQAKNTREGDDIAQMPNVEDPEHRLDRWKQWMKDGVDELQKLPRGFAQDSQLAQDLTSIFEEIEKKPRLPTITIKTGLEDSVAMTGTKILEDLEIWMPDRGDSIKWEMTDIPPFDVPEATLPDNLQDMVGDLIEDLEEFDEGADDVTNGSGGNLPQAGWDVMDGPISSFSATGKTGNQMPNASEITGRSGAGRRGRASGQMVGETSEGMEGRPTPARLTAERYEEGMVKSTKQLDPRGATGGGKKTGGGQRGLQGGTPPDVVENMERLAQKYKMVREQAEQIVQQQAASGRPATRVQRVAELMQSAEQDVRDLRYDDAARKRRAAISDLRAEQLGVDQAVNLSLQKSRDLPADLRRQIGTQAQQTLPEGYEEMVSTYYRAISEAGGSGK